MKRLIAGAAATAIVFGVATVYIDSQISPATPAVVLLSGITFGALAATMLRATRGWSLRAVGLFLMLAGVATLLIGAWVDYQWDIDRSTTEHVNDAILALWIVGSPLSLMGVCLYWIGGDRSDHDDLT